MPEDANGATSTASETVDAKSGANNLNLAEATAKLFASAKTAAATKPEQATEQVAQGAENTSKDSQTESVAEDENSQANQTDETDLAENDTTADETETEADDDVLSQNRQGLDDKTKQKIQKRIDKITARAKAAEAELAELRKQREQQAQQQPAYVPPSDLPPEIASLNDPSAIEAKRKEAKQAIRVANQLLDAESEGDALPDGVTRKALKEARAKAQLALEDYLPAREEFLRRRSGSLAQAVQAVPALKDTNSEEYQLAQAFLRNDPVLLNHWNAPMLAALHIEGQKALRSRTAAAPAKEKTAVKPKVPVAKPASDQTAVSSSGGGSRSPGVTAVKQALESKRAEFGSRGAVSADEASKYLLQREQLRNSR